jgi:hypothetical protein
MWLIESGLVSFSAACWIDPFPNLPRNGCSPQASTMFQSSKVRGSERPARQRRIVGHDDGELPSRC